MEIDEVHDIINKNGLREKYDKVRELQPDLDDQLKGIREHYCLGNSPYFDQCEKTGRDFLMMILSDTNLREIHSARFRIKSIDSLLSKYIEKKTLLPKLPGSDYNIEKYRPMDQGNYYKVITDLIGVRVLVRYQQQWRVIHDWILKYCNYNDEASYVKNWIDDFPCDRCQHHGECGECRAFLAERPKLYFRNEREMPNFKWNGEDIFETNKSEGGYSSIHYVIWHKGNYIEVQVRTIYDEAWSECTHDLVYKCDQEPKKRKLEKLSQCLATQTQAAEQIAELMYDEHHELDDSSRSELPLLAEHRNDFDAMHHEKFVKYFDYAIKGLEREKPFDGVIDSLFQ